VSVVRSLRGRLDTIDLEHGAAAVPVFVFISTISGASAGEGKRGEPAHHGREGFAERAAILRCVWGFDGSLLWGVWALGGIEIELRGLLIEDLRGSLCRRSQ
jgi:hypothetical protein